ncbi:MAG: signal peptidase II, partial [Eubacteriales bacterium]
MIDRLFAENGAVTDFLEFTFIDFPVFNVADICVTVGAVIMFIYLVFIDKTFFTEKEKKPSEKANDTNKEEQHD